MVSQKNNDNNNATPSFERSAYFITHKKARIAPRESFRGRSVLAGSRVPLITTGSSRGLHRCAFAKPPSKYKNARR